MSHGPSLKRLARAISLMLVVIVPSSCNAPRGEPQPVALEVIGTSSAISLQLNASPGVRINARLKPTLELEKGRNITFDAARLTPDSAYFAEAPRAEVAGRLERISGTLRVSVCEDAASYCTTLTLPINEMIPKS